MELSLDSEDIVEKLSLGDITNREWTILACSGKSKEGLEEGLDWIVKAVNKK